MPRLALSSPPSCTYCILVIAGGGTGLLEKRAPLCLLMAYVLYHSVKGIGSKTWIKKLLENICSLNLSTESTVFLPHQCLDKSFFPTESYSSVQRLVWCPHFAFCCSNKNLTPLLSFQCCHFQWLGVGGSMNHHSPEEREVRISVSLP